MTVHRSHRTGRSGVRPPNASLGHSATTHRRPARSGDRWTTRDDPDDPEPAYSPARGTLEPVLRHSTERAKVTPVIRPPVLPPQPHEDGPFPARTGPVSWDEAMAADVVPGKKRRRGRLARARHESGGVEEEYRPRVGADRSLTLLVVGMLLVLAVLVGVAVWAFWPRGLGARSLPHVAATGQLAARQP